MKYRGLLLDIDNTLYDYEFAHNHAQSAVLDLCSMLTQCSTMELSNSLKKAKLDTKSTLIGTAASHHRLIYFQKMLENLKINPLPIAHDLYRVYWEEFIANIVVYDGVYELLEKYKNNICLVTDMLANIQYQKIRKMRLDLYIDKLATSEEAGVEKPHPYIFLLAINKLQMNKKNVCMIGDSFEKDIVGAKNVGINAIWININEDKKRQKSKGCIEIDNFKKILELV